jgi:hypothetical protein
MENFMNILVASIVFVVFVVIILQYVLNLWFSGHIHEATRNIFEIFTEGFQTEEDEEEEDKDDGGVKPEQTPEQTPEQKPEQKPEQTPEQKPETNLIGDTTDYATMNSTNISELYDKVNQQTDIIRTLKVPYTEKAYVATYNKSEVASAVNMNVFNNLLTLLQEAIKPNDIDLKTNIGITQLYQYTGNESIDELISELSLLSEQTIANQHKSLPTDSCTDADSICIQKIYKQFDRKLEADYIAKVAVIVNSQQTIIDKVLQKQE